MTPAPPVVAVSGHMVDTPDRPRPRFPPGQVARVTAEARDALEEWGVGPGTTVITGGARGADIIVAEEALARGADVRLRLALPPEEFVRQSVELPDSDWRERFDRLVEASEVQELSGGGEDVFARTNRWIVEEARSLSDRPAAVIVWNGQEGDGPGGTRDFVSTLGYRGPSRHVRVIDPTPRAYEARQVANGPKRLLALDGGGIRGALSLGILAGLETELRRVYADDRLVLADYFDSIAGTSTGAIIAAALALGRPVDEVSARYETLGEKVFKKRFLPLQLRSRYRDGPLDDELGEFFGPDRTLGDPALRTLLLVVLHNVGTDSPWPLSNCTQAKYNRADRYLVEPPDRNLDLPLTTVIRGSTAAPTYFPPQELRVGRHEFVFEDGGVTPFNNPALLLFLMSVLPEYGLGWPVGEENLLVVSVGTGAAAAVHPNVLARNVHAGFHLKNLPGVFMNGASVSQDLLCRALGRCRAGAEIDREFGARLDMPGIGDRSLFTYARYNADLSDAPEEQRRLDAWKEVPQLQARGRAIGSTISVEHDFAGFLG